MANQTTFSEIITDYAMVMIDDERLSVLAKENPARFFRKMALYMQTAIPMFTHPPEARIWLRYTPPTFDDATYTVTGEEGVSAAVNTGITGYTLASAAYTMEDGYGGLMDVPVPVLESDPETGEIILAVSEDIPPDTVIDIDIYTDGVFDRELDSRIKRILSLFVQYAWYSRYMNDWLIVTPKIKDKSFDTGNESNLTRANNERARLLLDEAYGEMLRLEQDAYYMDTAGMKESMINPGRPGI